MAMRGATAHESARDLKNELLSARLEPRDNASVSVRKSEFLSTRPEADPIEVPK